MASSKPKYLCNKCAGENQSLKTCAKCQMVQYCNVTCQRSDWETHKDFCKRYASKMKDLKDWRNEIDRMQIPHVYDEEDPYVVSLYNWREQKIWHAEFTLEKAKETNSLRAYQRANKLYDEITSGDFDNDPTRAGRDWKTWYQLSEAKIYINLLLDDIEGASISNGLIKVFGRRHEAPPTYLGFRLAEMAMDHLEDPTKEFNPRAIFVGISRSNVQEILEILTDSEASASIADDCYRLEFEPELKSALTASDFYQRTPGLKNIIQGWKTMQWN